jgi:replicative DNA helicase
MKDNLELKTLKTLLIDKKSFYQFVNNKTLIYLFNNKYNKFIFELIVEFFQRYNTIPTSDIILNMIDDNISQDNIKKQMMDHFIMIDSLDITEGEINYLIDNLNTKIKDSIIKQTGVTPKVLEDTFQKISELENTTSKYKVRHLWDIVERNDRQIIPTGLQVIDECGIGKGELGLLLAGTGVGKSVFLTYVANNFMLKGYKTLHIVFEGDIDTYLESHQRKLKYPTKEQLESFNQGKNLKLYQMGANTTTISDIQKLIVELSNDNFIPDVIVIDYLDCIVGENNKKEIWQNDIVIINELERLAIKYNVAVWSAVQANRTGLNKELQLENMSGSISKSQKATLIASLRRTEEHQETNTAHIKILKNRYGMLKESFNCIWNPVTMEISAPINYSPML